ncbi:hypothetical protein ACRALDRAFT_207433 [Sodiomyces alcalophilus JCM 7366]|uniref:uncharacterized protein n=1 Tax=Sodiomyces alcalophilus JCM 7366 TaxID=591952 RepID=UPI0039B67961
MVVLLLGGAARNGRIPESAVRRFTGRHAYCYASLPKLIGDSDKDSDEDIHGSM